MPANQSENCHKRQLQDCTAAHACERARGRANPELGDECLLQLPRGCCVLLPSMARLKEGMIC